MNPLVSFPPVHTTCPYCGVGCGIIARPDGHGGAVIEGDPAHPANYGRLCSKGSALGETLSRDGRLLHPLVRGPGGTLERTAWDAALTRVADGLSATIERHGPDSVAFYVSGQLLTEDYYVANKLMKGFIGSANIDTNSRLCMASAVAGHKRAFGSDAVPGCYKDLDQADLLVLVGSNAAWCHPVLHQRMTRNRRERGARIVVIDPRRTASAEDADLVLPIAPGMDSVFFCGLLVHLAETDALDRTFISEHTEGFGETLARARHIAPDHDAVSERCGLPGTEIARAYDWFRTTERTVTVYSQGVNQSAQGTDKVNAIINCHLATGRIGKPGMGPFSLTGQPNAMGGREVGGLANQLAAHMGFDEKSLERVARFWKAPRLAHREGLKALDMFEAVASGRIKALWVMGTNPAVSLPRADAARAALAALDLFVVSDVVRSTDTISAMPHVLLPAAAWGEKDGTVTNSERRISRQRAFLEPPGEVRPDWWILSEVARRMGHAAAFPYRCPADIFREHAQLSALDNGGARAFHIAALARLVPAAYDALEPVQWPLRGGEDGSGLERLFGDGRFLTASGRARFVPVAHPELAAECDTVLTLLLNTGRVRDQWHTMTRTGKSPRLAGHTEEPCIDVHPDDAAAAGLVHGGFARLSAQGATAILRVVVTEAQRRGEVFAPIHWNGDTASHARIGALVAAACDPYSGQPELKATPVSVAPVSYAVQGVFLTRHFAALPRGIWWARVAIEGGSGYRLAAPEPREGLAVFARTLLGSDRAPIGYEDEGRGIFRAAVLVGDRLEACLFLARDPALVPDWSWLKRQLACPALSPAERRALLAGRMPDAAHDAGPVICACFGVGRLEIEKLAREDCAATVETVGRSLKAGTNCGSCQPEIRRLLASVKKSKQEIAAA